MNYPKIPGFNLYQSRHCAYITYSVKTWVLKNLSVEEENFTEVIYVQSIYIYDELRQGPGPDLGPRLNGYGDRTIMGTGHYGDRLISGPAIIGTGSLVACNDRSGPENDTPGPETRGAVPKMIPPVPKRE